MPDTVNASSPTPILQRLLEMEEVLWRRVGGGWREVIHETLMLAAREVWADGCRHLPSGIAMHPGYAVGEGADLIAATARERFPLPPRKVLREEGLEGGNEPFVYRAHLPIGREPAIHWRDPRRTDAERNVWRWLADHDAPTPTAGRIRLWADLLANPYREEPQ